MIKRRNLLTFLAVTVIAVVVVAVSTESVRDYVSFDWQVNEGDQFLYDVSVTGYFRSGEHDLLLTLAPLNNTQVAVEMISLPDVPRFISPSSFAENIIEFEKTHVSYADGTPIHLNGLFGGFVAGRTLSRCFLRAGRSPPGPAYHK